ncbi:hypothetical protein [Jeotgalibacillus malaysiensis]|uniref:hypothetical protein n=1 Tax=Jeotgalibacillus malaysiensis TaxID=1508404 RepID=UPI00384B61D7
MVLRGFIMIAAILVLIAGSYSFNNEPSQFSTIFLGVSLSSLFLLVGLKEWPKEKGKVAGVIMFIGAVTVFIQMVSISIGN